MKRRRDFVVLFMSAKQWWCGYLAHAQWQQVAEALVAGVWVLPAGEMRVNGLVVVRFGRALDMTI